MNTKIGTGATGAPAVTLVGVESSNVAAVGFLPGDQKNGDQKNDGEATGCLFVKFVGGAIYRYADVPPHVHAALMAAASKGKYVAAHIRGAYPFVKL